jgi:hypothetical protein
LFLRFQRSPGRQKGREIGEGRRQALHRTDHLLPREFAVFARGAAVRRLMMASHTAAS